MQTQDEIRKQYNLPAHISNTVRAGHDAVIEVTPGGSMLLKRKLRADGYGYDWDYVGDVREDEGEYVIVLAAPYDPETGSDVTEIGRFADQEAAINKLWELRTAV